MIIDTSAILSIFFREKYADWVIEQLKSSHNELKMSTVNLTETLIRIQDKQPKGFHILKNKLMDSDIRFIPPCVEQANIAAQSRIKFPLNLGDCFAYALAITEKDSLLTLDKDFKCVDCHILYPH